MLAMADFRFWVMAPKFYFVLMITSGFCCFELLCCGYIFKFIESSRPESV